MVIAKTPRLRSHPARPARIQDPMLFLQALGIVEKNGHALETLLDSYFRRTLGNGYRTRLEKSSTVELRERARRYIKTDEKLSDLVIQMREE